MLTGTLIGLAFFWVWAWMRYRDPFHPLIYLLPQLAFLYAVMPLALLAEDPVRFAWYTGGPSVARYQAIVILLIASLIGGVVVATAGVTRRRARWHSLDIVDEAGLRTLAVALGGIGLAAWLYVVLRAGGFMAAYGGAYGGGWVPSGHIREARFVGLVGALLIYLSRVGRGMRAADWALVALCVFPTLFHGLVGARRGPTFLALVVAGGGYIYFMRKKVPVPLIIGGGLLVGALLMFLVANRAAIHLGAEALPVTDPLAHLNRWSSNEYLVGSAVVRYADMYGSHYGMRELVWLIGRVVPSAIWPTIYLDLPLIFGIDVDLRLNGGVNPLAIASLVNWAPTKGSAEGFVASLWLEFGLFAPFVAFAIGTVHGTLWKRARSSLAARVVALLAAALSVYLVMQALDPWLYRLLLFGLSAWLLLRTVRARPTLVLAS
ncbi:MAG: oligosaccharide repeat unit polymerase [Devosia sp.]